MGLSESDFEVLMSHCGLCCVDGTKLSVVLSSSKILIYACPGYISADCCKEPFKDQLDGS